MLTTNTALYIVSFQSSFPSRGNFPERLGTPYQAGPPCDSCENHCKTAKSPYQERSEKKKYQHEPEENSVFIGQRRKRHQKMNRKSLKSRQMHGKRLFRKRQGRSRSSRRNLRRPHLRKQRTYRRQNKEINAAHPLAVPKWQKSNNKNQRNGYKMCTNSCPVADLWINCEDIAKVWREWLCDEKDTEEGKERFKNCRATCICQGKIKN